MEILAQWLDDLDDLFSAVGLLAERLRNLLITASIVSISFILQLAAIVLALHQPPLACAIATMLLVFLMYRSATAPRPPAAQVA